MTIIDFLSAGEPTLTLPYIALALRLLNNRHPPIDANKQHKTNAPFEKYPDQIGPTKQNKPQAAVLALYIGQLNVCAATFRTLLIKCHNKIPLYLFW